MIPIMAKTYLINFSYAMLAPLFIKHGLDNKVRLNGKIVNYFKFDYVRLPRQKSIKIISKISQPSIYRICFYSIDSTGI